MIEFGVFLAVRLVVKSYEFWSFATVTRVPKKSTVSHGVALSGCDDFIRAVLSLKKCCTNFSR